MNILILNHVEFLKNLSGIPCSGFIWNKNKNTLKYSFLQNSSNYYRGADIFPSPIKLATLFMAFAGILVKDNKDEVTPQVKS